jgi:hypothetical protein
MTPTTEAGKSLAFRLATHADRDYHQYGVAIAAIEAEARADALTALRERVILTQLDPCFCDDYGQLPECEACLRARAVLAEIDRALEP